jgi:hypothetical protein
VSLPRSRSSNSYQPARCVGFSGEGESVRRSPPAVTINSVRRDHISMFGPGNTPGPAIDIRSLRPPLLSAASRIGHRMSIAPCIAHRRCIPDFSGSRPEMAHRGTAGIVRSPGPATLDEPSPFDRPGESPEDQLAGARRPTPDLETKRRSSY